MNNKSQVCKEILTLHFIGLAVLVGSVFKTDICNMEQLDLKCPGKDQIIVVTKALYGRMERCRCVEKNFDVGCGTDVTGWVEDKCSGRHKCQERISVPDTDLYNMLKCSKEATSYLQTVHQCVQAVPLDRCKTERTIRVEGDGYLSPHNALRECFIHLEAAEGQRINLTLHDFGGYQFSRGIKHRGTSSICQRYAHIAEKGRNGMDVCGDLQSLRNVYLSETSSLDIRLSSDANKKFLFHFELAGCGRPTVPHGVDVEVSGSRAVAVCNLTGEKTHLICKGVQWVGHVNPCVAQTTSEESGTLLGQRWSSPVGLVIVVALGIAIGTIVGVCALLFFAFCFVRKKNKKAPVFTRPVPYDSPRGGSSVSKNYLQLSTVTTDSGEPPTEILLSKCTLKRHQKEDAHPAKVAESVTSSFMADTDKPKCKRIEVDCTQKYETSFIAKV